MDWSWDKVFKIAIFSIPTLMRLGIKYAAMDSRYQHVVVLIFAVVFIVVVAGFILPAFLPGSSSNETKQLASVEVRSYQWNDLSSINDFHENSILGPQHINESDYNLTVSGLTSTTKISTYHDILNNHQHYTKVVMLHCVEGGMSQYSGKVYSWGIS